MMEFWLNVLSFIMVVFLISVAVTYGKTKLERCRIASGCLLFCSVVFSAWLFIDSVLGSPVISRILLIVGVLAAAQIAKQLVVNEKQC